ncbi:hypothetical protein ACFL96_20375 [Thermoproteota archaeon]
MPGCNGCTPYLGKGVSLMKPGLDLIKDYNPIKYDNQRVMGMHNQINLLDPQKAGGSGPGYQRISPDTKAGYNGGPSNSGYVSMGDLMYQIGSAARMYDFGNQIPGYRG